MHLSDCAQAQAYPCIRCPSVPEEIFTDNVHLRKIAAFDRFTAIFHKGDNFDDFLFAFLYIKPLLKGLGSYLPENISI